MRLELSTDSAVGICISGFGEVPKGNSQFLSMAENATLWVIRNNPHYLSVEKRATATLLYQIAKS